MQCSRLAILVFSVLAARPASADVYKVEVGKGGLRYTPNNIKADKGDIVEFHFDAMHSVIAGDFKKPCTPVSSGGFYSGVLPDGNKVSSSGRQFHPPSPFIINSVVFQIEKASENIFTY